MALPPLPPASRVLILGQGPRCEEPRRRFLAAGCDVLGAALLRDALDAIEAAPPRLMVVLESASPGRRTGELCEALRSIESAPIIVLGHDGDELGRVEALSGGADACLPFTVSERELLAHASMLFRRAPNSRPRERRFGGLCLDLLHRGATLWGTPLELTAYEYLLLRLLAEREGQPVSRDELLSRAKGSLELSFDRSIDVHVCRLRRKLGPAAHHLKTVRGVGYRFDPLPLQTAHSPRPEHEHQAGHTVLKR